MNVKLILNGALAVQQKRSPDRVAHTVRSLRTKMSKGSKKFLKIYEMTIGQFEFT